MELTIYVSAHGDIHKYSTPRASPLGTPQIEGLFKMLKMHQNNAKFRILHGFETVSEPSVLTGRVDFLIFGMCHLRTCGGCVDAKTPSGAVSCRRYRGSSLPVPYLWPPPLVGGYR